MMDAFEAINKMLWGEPEPKYGSGMGLLTEDDLFHQHLDNCNPKYSRSDVIKENKRLRLHGRLNEKRAMIELRESKIKDLKLEIEDLTTQFKDIKKQLFREGNPK